MLGFDVVTHDMHSQARRGRLTLAHGVVQTPAFMPIGTVGAVKGLLPGLVKDIGAEIILANTYHFFVRPGVEVVEKLGGLHRFMAWDHPILTDSGGYQVFSLSSLNKIDDEGVAFNSHVDGRHLYLNAQIATEVQNRLGADIIMCFDQCTHFPCERSDLEIAVKRTLRWAALCQDTHANERQMLFGIVQGGIDLDLRAQCAEALVDLDFPGYAIGGLSVGEGHDHMVRTVDYTAPLLPVEKPRYLMGVGMPADLIAAVAAGVDMFDCVLPTRNGRNSYAFTESGPLRLRNSKHSASDAPIEAACDCVCCRHYTCAAIRHFFICGEMLGPILLSLHNLRFFQRLMSQMRGALETGEFSSWATDALRHYRASYATLGNGQ
ncbi:tRNA guanosine(34) transglycosylase Tgt [Planctomycetota bacterium]